MNGKVGFLYLVPILFILQENASSTAAFFLAGTTTNNPAQQQQLRHHRRERAPTLLPRVKNDASVRRTNGLKNQRSSYCRHHSMLPDAFLLAAVSDIIILAADPINTAAAAAVAIPPVDAGTMVQPLSKETTIAVFIVGVIPFGIATYEFWRRIAVGASFGTNNDSVVFLIGEDDAPTSSRGRQVLGRDSLVTAYLIFAVAIAVLGLVLFSVATSPDPADFIIQQQQQQQ
jgi:hypothetical protein